VSSVERARAGGGPTAVALGDGEPDAALVARAAGGDAGAFGALVRRHLPAAHAVARRVVRDEADAEDVCQDAFLAALARIDTCRPAARFRPWLLQIVKHRALDLRRSQRVREARPLGDGPGEADPAVPARESPAAHAERASLRQSLRAAMSSLSQTRQRVLLLHDVHGWPHAEIARRLGLAEATSRAHLFHARRGMRARLSPELLGPA
jgi:RNA polymerase sigma-70 factor (ECF subfamily)